jgi:phosphoribosylformylglycinamidine synthase
LNKVELGDVHSVAISHGEGRFVCKENLAKKLFENGQVATQYVDFNGNPTYDIEFNPNGSMYDCRRNNKSRWKNFRENGSL